MVLAPRHKYRRMARAAGVFRRAERTPRRRRARAARKHRGKNL